MSDAALNRKIDIRNAHLDHLDMLVKLEEQCFVTDRLSRRSLRRFLNSEQVVFLVALKDGICIGYLLIIFHRGTSLARLYSIAIDEQYRRKGIGKALMLEGESRAQLKGALYIRLEVNQTNLSAIEFYHQFDYKEFGLLPDYYDDHTDAWRMQKRIRQYRQGIVKTPLPWCQQSTPFTCGPAALMMAMAGLKKNYQANLTEELQLWREATTIFMTSGHGGCHPLGLALSAARRGFSAEVWISQSGALFIDGVRSEEKKSVIQHVHADFLYQATKENIEIYYQNIEQQRLADACDQGAVPIVLISTYRMDRKKAPHWVAVTGYDEHCFYVHDPDPDEKHQDLVDCQYLPIARADFEKMSSFGSSRLRTAVILSSIE
ncbi:GNAT family N-acetyltransferase/peptidase C39 family protein [Neptunicella sp. SCSIO 80796]|uniref:GNAT family N-acetyltransferase/peptidase C39 family protein n=1 Tax=Neptunicella plasticusilytica TaxID=3117012 RepID=UPI003A4E2F0B